MIEVKKSKTIIKDISKFKNSNFEDDTTKRKSYFEIQSNTKNNKSNLVNFTEEGGGGTSKKFEKDNLATAENKTQELNLNSFIKTNNAAETDLKLINKKTLKNDNEKISLKLMTSTVQGKVTLIQKKKTLNA